MRATVATLWNELQQLLYDARQAKLDVPELLEGIYTGGPHVQMDKLAKVWFECEKNLNKVAHDITAASEEAVAATRPAFEVALKEFCGQTEQMNRGFTVGALQALEREITRKFENQTDDTHSPRGAAVA